MEEIKLPIKFIDTIDIWNSKVKLFDTNDVRKFHLLDMLDSNDLRYPPQNLLGYHCAPIGYVRLKKIYALIYYTLRSEAGSGNPTIFLKIVDKNFNVLDECELLSFFIQSDPYYPYSGRLSNWAAFTDSVHFFKVELSASWYDFDINDTLPTQIASIRASKNYYQITPQGKIEYISGSDSEIFENKNPIYYKKGK